MPIHHQTASFEASVQVYWNKLLAVAVAKTNAHDAFDIVQDVLMAAWEKWEDLPKDEQLEYYLLNALKFRVLNYYRSAGRYSAHLKTLEDLLTGTIEEASAIESEALMETVLKEAIDMLSPHQQKLFVLRLRHQYSYKKIATELDIAPGSARVLYSRALEQVKDHIRSNPALSAQLVSAMLLFTIS
ncbi:sigma-70 family RNA polymerase sigma factor [Chitinophaga horti]|uniref:Sigma-70 family RNA polymerase sigma factor n=1 Tax=Chitinophaga horti TaxID=2920382 RepID=A0ABY6IV19_9BACT|nr:sigma-70 family RNA polymerase sigma factor [Chitinophaga horti]UYQ91218.1 sigma-70 family RNA polymerase sigma factor [Chitinophaga horti]